MKRYLFSKNQRLRTRGQFKEVLSRKCCVSNKLVRLYVAKNSCGYPRFGVSVSKSWGNAVVRNRIKRLAREVFRLEQHNVSADYDYLLIFSRKMSKNNKSVGQTDKAGLTFENLRAAFPDLARGGVRKANRRE